MKVRVKTHVHLAGEPAEASGPGPRTRVFEPGQMVEIDDATAKASPCAFQPLPEAAGSN
jgi:hypothetical protein